MKIILPLSVTIPRKTKEDRIWILNLNNYRNTHHMTLNQSKVLWKEIVNQAIPSIPIIERPEAPFLFTYTIYASSNRKFDLANVCSIIQKFTDDALIDFGVISDDSYKVIPAIDYRFGGVDKDNPRCELTIRDLGDNLPF
ncbi:MAG: hypothetical protein WC332_00765 [Clostridia bacterium]|jgi:hypothetical protein